MQRDNQKQWNLFQIQWNWVITYPQGKWKEVRSNQSTFYPKRDFTSLAGPVPRVHANDSATEDASPSWMSFIICFSYGEIAFHGIMSLKRAGKLKSKLKGCMTCSWSEKKRTKERAKKCSWRENWYVISDFVPRSVRLIQKKKKCTCFPIGDVRDRRRERYNRVYVLSRVRNNRVSLYSKLAFRTQGRMLLTAGATFLLCAFLSHRLFTFFQRWFFSKSWMFLSWSWHVLKGFRRDVLRQHVLRKASSL